MEFITADSIAGLKNPGVVSRQLLNPENSQSRRVTLTEVHLEPGACQPRHTHAHSEQIWYAVRGAGKLLLAGGGRGNFMRGTWRGLRMGTCMAWKTRGTGNSYIFPSPRRPLILDTPTRKNRRKDDGKHE